MSNQDSTPNKQNLGSEISKTFKRVEELLYSEYGSENFEAGGGEGLIEVKINDEDALQIHRTVMLVHLKEEKCLDIRRDRSFYVAGGQLADDIVTVKFMHYGYDMYSGGETICTTMQYNFINDVLKVNSEVKCSGGGYSVQEYNLPADHQHYLAELNYYLDNADPVNNKDAGIIRKSYFKFQRNPWPKIIELLVEPVKRNQGALGRFSIRRFFGK